MKAIFVLALTIACVFAHSFPENDGVITLTDATFEQAMSEFPHMLVKFYAPWCGHCKKLAPEYSKAAQALKAMGSPAVLAELDASEEKEVSSKHSIQGFPTLKFFTEGNVVDYNAGRQEKDIVNWISKRTGDITTHLKTKEEFDNFLKENKAAVVYFTRAINDAAYNILKGVAMNEEKIAFAHVFDESIAVEQKAGLDNNVVLFKQYDEGRNDFKEELTAENLKKFLKENSFPTVMEFEDRAIDRIFQEGTPAIILFATSNDESSVALEAFEQAAHGVKGGSSVIFVKTLPTDGHGHFQRLADYVGVNTAKAPVAILIKSGREMEKFQFTKAFEKANIMAFVKQYEDEPWTLEKYLKSDEIPESNDGPIRTVVGKSFESEVVNNNKDVLVKFYAPWCGHCKAMQPDYEKVGEKMKKSNPNIVIAEMDATTNETPSVNIKGFPTIKFWKAGAKDAPMDFEGDRTEDGIIKFLKENTTQTWAEPSDAHSDL